MFLLHHEFGDLGGGDSRGEELPKRELLGEGVEEFAFSAAEYDVGVGLVYYDARWGDERLGRVCFAGGDWGGCFEPLPLRWWEIILGFWQNN